MVHPCAKGEEEAVRSPTFSEDLFSSAITRERKRTERSGLAIVLVLLCREERERNSDVPEIWRGVGDALRAVKSDIDLVGWFEQGTVMGLLSLDIAMSDLARECDRLETQLRKELTGRFDAEKASRFSIRLRVYPEPMRSEEEACLLEF